ncbi:hypothetical protein ACRALDRAFT_1077013 [Sodiomyces alcalophilus JCM 7366]|uniref:uncharacterized protein n=1 Tax=Sodiomyces alcalophilus JCM 7366 TaxID=591952 RepID=UPI0039B48104
MSVVICRDSQSESSCVDKTSPDKTEMGTGAHKEDAELGNSVPPAAVAEIQDRLFWVRIREDCLEAFSEFFGTMILVLFGDGVVAQVVLSKETKGDYQSISWGWGLGVMLGVYVAGKSGGHLNPAVTLANCIFRKHPWRKLPIYTIAQILGAMVAAFVVYGNYRPAIDHFEGGSGIRTVTGPTATAGIFCTYPAEFMDRTSMFWSEFIASTILQFVIFALLDKDNICPPQFVPLGLFFLIFGIGACWGWETGYAINPARDFGPRLVSYIVGYPAQVWSAGNYYFWIPMVAPLVGCAFGGFLYDVFIYTGESPMNTPWMGLRRLFHPRRNVWSNTYQLSLDSKV